MDMKVLETKVRDILIKRRDAGIEWISGRKPDWYKSIDLGSFDFGDPGDCVLGQVYGTDAYGKVGDGPDKFAFYYNHGFTVSTVNISKDLPDAVVDADETGDNINNYMDGPAWEVMNELWKESIKALQNV